MNGSPYHGIRNASTMPTFKRKKIFDPDKFREAIESAKAKGLITQTIEHCKKCLNPVLLGSTLCQAHSAVYSIGKAKNAIQLTKQCLFCKKDYITTYKYAMYCSSYCKYKQSQLRAVKPVRKKEEIKCSGKGCKTRFIKAAWNHKYCEPCRLIYR